MLRNLNWVFNANTSQSLYIFHILKDGKERRLTIAAVGDSDQGEYSFQSKEDDQINSITATLELTGGKVKVEKKKSKSKYFIPK